MSFIVILILLNLGCCKHKQTVTANFAKPGIRVFASVLANQETQQLYPMANGTSAECVGHVMNANFASSNKLFMWKSVAPNMNVMYVENLHALLTSLFSNLKKAMMMMKQSMRKCVRSVPMRTYMVFHNLGMVNSLLVYNLALCKGWHTWKVPGRGRGGPLGSELVQSPMHTRATITIFRVYAWEIARVFFVKASPDGQMYRKVHMKMHLFWENDTSLE
jgi:hypothetical protein